LRHRRRLDADEQRAIEDDESGAAAKASGGRSSLVAISADV
jgi:hypothetical protein